MSAFLYKIIRYGLVGGLVFVAQLAALTFMVETKLASPLVASIGAFTIAVVLSFFLQRRVTFMKTDSVGIQREFSLTIILAIFNLGFNAFSMHILLVAGVHYLIAQFLVTGVIVVYTYIAYHYIFKL